MDLGGEMGRTEKRVDLHSPKTQDQRKRYQRITEISQNETTRMVNFYRLHILKQRMVCYHYSISIMKIVSFPRLRQNCRMETVVLSETTIPIRVGSRNLSIYRVQIKRRCLLTEEYEYKEIGSTSAWSSICC